MAVFLIFEDELGSDRGNFWQFRLDREPLQDLPVSQRDIDDYGFNRGFSRWSDGDRISYHTAYAFWQHQDPGFHDFINALRFHWQEHGQPVPVGRIIDQGMSENPFDPNATTERQGLAIYPYERVAIPLNLVDFSRPGGIVEVIHQRRRNNQVLQTIVIPEVSPQNPRVRWYYQLGGKFLAVHETYGVISSIIIAAMFPAYTFRIRGVLTGGA